SDISRFPKGLLAFFTSLFGLGLQTMTVGLEASHRDDEDFAGQPGREPPLRWRWVALVAGVLGAPSPPPPSGSSSTTRSA
ncbi:MAG TPA: hypothetical protein VHK23_02840, partial [Miltoncostaeaceae bacterium]|nr:hypothetical protein [Miltoncostaeaceae bacterium]